MINAKTAFILHKVLLMIYHLDFSRHGFSTFLSLLFKLRFMKYTLLLLVTCIYLTSAARLQAQTQQKLTINNATVFISGAELVSTTSLSLVKGENTVLFSNVAGDVNNQSIIVNATNGVVVAGVTFQNNYLPAEELSPAAQQIKDSIELVTTNRQQVHNKITVLDEDVALLWRYKRSDSSKADMPVSELVKLLDLINTRMEGFLNQKSRLQDEQKKIDEHLAKLKKQLGEEQKKGYQSGGQLLVKFYAKEAVNTNVTVDYIVPHAGWSPTYDIMADDVNSPVKLFYKANIFQNSGVKWSNVHLTLSTGNPNEGAQTPVMNPWYLAFYVPRAYPLGNAAIAFKADKAVRQDDAVLNDPITANEVSTMNQYVSVNNSGINTSFDIDLPYTIPNDGQQHLVAIKKYELPATYRYYAVPKLDKDAFLQAQVTNWEDLNLLPGQTNIFYEGTFVGHGFIDARNLNDTMTISLGRDKKIVIKRDRDVKLRSVRTIGTNIRETFAYDITVRNTRKENITLIVQDQQPVSNDKDIVTEDKETSGADYDETTGMMKWTLQLNTNETKKISFGYTVKYPKGKTVDNLNR